MTTDRATRRYSPAEKTGIFCLTLALPSLFFIPALATVPLMSFLLLCAMAPFCRTYGFFLPLVSRGERSGNRVALTFDDGPSPQSTPIILDLLKRHMLPATFFVVGEQVRRHPELLRDIIAHGHSIGLHSLNHDLLLAIRGDKRITEDLEQSQKIVQEIGVHSFVFRPPVAITSPRLTAPLARAGLLTVTFSCSAGDLGNRRITHLCRKILDRLHPGAIVMLHDLPPPQDSLREPWQKELDLLFQRMVKQYTIIPLAELIRHPVSTPFPSSGPTPP